MTEKASKTPYPPGVFFLGGSVVAAFIRVLFGSCCGFCAVLYVESDGNSD
jgi:hypothetical protein